MKKLLILILFISGGIVAQAQTNYQRDSLAHDGEWQQRVRIASITAAKDILAAQGQEVYLINYCQLIVSYPFGDGGWLDAMSYAVASSPAITLEATDSDIQFTVNANIDKYAKAYYKVITLAAPQIEGGISRLGNELTWQFPLVLEDYTYSRLNYYR